MGDPGTFSQGVLARDSFIGTCKGNEGTGWVGESMIKNPTEGQPIYWPYWRIPSENLHLLFLPTRLITLSPQYPPIKRPDRLGTYIPSKPKQSTVNVNTLVGESNKLKAERPALINGNPMALCS